MSARPGERRGPSARFWRRAFLGSTALCAVTFAVNVAIGRIAPDNAWGLTYGTVATVLMVAVAFYAVRRRMMARDVGNTRQWLKLHVYGGLLFFFLMLMHSGFRLPAGGLNWLIWVLTLWVTASGLAGLCIQKWIPKLLSSGLSVEAVYERIPDLVGELREKAEAVFASSADPVREFYTQNIAPAMASPTPRAIYYLDITGGIQGKMRQCDFLGRVLSAGDRQNLAALTSLYRTKLELDAHYTLQRALRWWLYTHVPLSLILLIAVAIHIFAAFYY